MRKKVRPVDYKKAFDFSGKTIAITGAAGQLGFQLVQTYADLGATVIALDLHIPDTFLNQTTSPQILIVWKTLDITNQAQVIETFNTLVEQNQKLDVLINNAGVSCFEPFESRPEKSFDWVMDVNLKGTFFCTQAYVKLAKEWRFTGNIVNIGSIYGVVSPNFRIYTDCSRQNSEVYGATKAGIIQMTRYFAANLARDQIRVNCVSPGGIENLLAGQGQDFVKNYSGRTPMGRLAKVEEIIGGILYFSSHVSSYTTGQNLIIDGGLTSW